MKEYKGEIARYIERELHTTLTPQQTEICDKLTQPPYRVLVPSANNQGKTYLLAGIASYVYDNYNPSITLVTAPKLDNVTHGVFRELRTLRKSSAGFLPSACILRTSTNHIVRGATAANPDGFQGVHGVDQTMIFDEATGVKRNFIQRAETMFQGVPGHHWIMAYNPNDPSAYVYDLEDNNDWHVVRLCALDHPNILAELLGKKPPIPSAIRLNRVWARMARECTHIENLNDVNEQTDFEFPRNTGVYWRPKTIEFEAQVLGRWPLLPTQSLLSPLQVGSLFGTKHDINLGEQLVISCDVARFGADKTVIVVRRGRSILHIEQHSKRDGNFVSDRLVHIINEFRAPDELPQSIPVYVDDTGGYGGSIVDKLAGYGIVPLNMASTSPDARYRRLRSCLWFTLADVIVGGYLDCTRIDLQTQSEIRRDLTAPRYRLDEESRRILEPKKQTKDRIGHSPDIGDALALSMFDLLEGV